MDNDVLLRRVERVERENRHLKLAALLLLVFVVGVAAVHRQTATGIEAKVQADILRAQQTLTVQKIIITDADGTRRGILTADKNGGFLLFQNGGDAALKLGLVGAEPHLDTPDPTSKTGFRNWLGKGGVIPAR